MKGFVVPLTNPSLLLAQAIVAMTLPYLLDEPCYSYSNALIVPSDRLTSSHAAQLHQIGGCELETEEAKLLFDLPPLVSGKRWTPRPITKGLLIPALQELKRDWDYVCVSSFTRVVGDQCRIEAYTARKEQP